LGHQKEAAGLARRSYKIHSNQSVNGDRSIMKILQRSCHMLSGLSKNLADYEDLLTAKDYGLSFRIRVC